MKHIISSLLAGLIIDKPEKKKHTCVHSAPTISSQLEQQHIKSRNKTIPTTYTPIDMAWFDEPEEFHGFFEISFLSDEELNHLQYFFSRLNVNPNSVECRTELIHYLFNLWRNENHTELVNIIQNELIYLIDYIQPIDQKEHMYQHLAMFISSECYFFQGELCNALKRLYQVLDWQDIYDNVEEKDGVDFNGLSNFHEHVISNIINIYALVNLPEQADKLRHCCNNLISSALTSYRSLMKHDRFRNTCTNSCNALLASNEIEGYFFFHNNNYNTENFFKEACEDVISEKPIYRIDCVLTPKENILIKNIPTMYELKFGFYPVLWFQCYGGIINYPMIIEREREKIKNV